MMLGNWRSFTNERSNTPEIIAGQEEIMEPAVGYPQAGYRFRRKAPAFRHGDIRLFLANHILQRFVR